MNRRINVLKIMYENKLCRRIMKSSDIAKKTGRTVQTVNNAIRDLERKELIRCITPGKITWKKFILTKKGIEVIEELKTNNLLIY